MCEEIRKIYESWCDERWNHPNPEETCVVSDKWQELASSMNKEEREELWFATLEYAHVGEQQAFENGFRIAFKLARELKEVL